MNRADGTKFLKMFGSKVPQHQPRAEWIVCDCPLGPWRHDGGQSSPEVFGLRVEQGDGFCHCLAGETLVPTPQGLTPIRNLAGTTATVMTTGGVWVDAPVRGYGRQPLMQIVLRSNGVLRTVHATAEHRWIARHGQVVLTKNLKKGHRLLSVLPSSEIPAPAPEGIRHGIVFGDGTVYRGRYAAVNLHGEKQELASWFGPYSVTEKGGYTRVYIGRAGEGWKELPPLSSPPSYLAGFIAGWLATDGCVDTHGNVTLSCHKRLPLEWLRSACLLVGLAIHPINEQMRLGYGSAETPMYSTTLVRSRVGENLLLRSKHRARAQKSSFDRTGWVVVSVAPTDRVEEVFCAEVEGTHTFALADNLLTGNCFSCGFHGTQTELIMQMKMLNTADFRKLYPFGEGMQLIAEAESEIDLDLDTPTIEDILFGQKKGHHIFPDWWLDTFHTVFDYPDAMEYLKTGRNKCDPVPDAVIKAMDMRYDPTQRRICFPVRDFKHQLVGLHGRAIDKATKPRYRMYTYQKKNNPIVWLGEDWVDLDRPILMVEGPFDLASVKRVYRNAVSPLFASPSFEKLRRMSDATVWLTFLDYGTGGDVGRQRVTEALTGNLVEHIIPPKGIKDPGECSLQQLVDILSPHLQLDEVLG